MSLLYEVSLNRWLIPQPCMLADFLLSRPLSLARKEGTRPVTSACSYRYIAHQYSAMLLPPVSQYPGFPKQFVCGFFTHSEWLLVAYAHLCTFIKHDSFDSPPVSCQNSKLRTQSSYSSRNWLKCSFLAAASCRIAFRFMQEEGLDSQSE